MQAKVEIVEPKFFVESVADEIVASISDAISENSKCCVALSGGSTPGALYRVLSRPPRVSEIDWPKLQLFLGDERWVPHDDVQSNYRMVQETLLHNLPKPGPKMYAVDTSLKNTQASAENYAALIQQVFALKSGGIPKFDLVLLGIGEDGHTASLFPHTDVLERHAELCHAVKHPVDGTMRVSLSADVLFAAKKILFIVKGASKAAIIKQVLQTEASIMDVPSRLYTRALDRVTFFLDSEAAAQL